MDRQGCGSKWTPTLYHHHPLPAFAYDLPLAFRCFIFSSCLFLSIIKKKNRGEKRGKEQQSSLIIMREDFVFSSTNEKWTNNIYVEGIENINKRALKWSHTDCLLKITFRNWGTPIMRFYVLLLSPFFFSTLHVCVCSANDLLSAPSATLFFFNLKKEKKYIYLYTPLSQTETW